MSATASDTAMTPEQALGVIARTLDAARACGATAVEAALSQSAGLSVTVRMGELETLQHQRDKTLQVTVYNGHRKGSASTSDLTGPALRQTAEAARAIARHAGEDPCAGLVGRAQLAHELPDLDLCHPWDIDVEGAIALATSCEAAARGVDARINNSDGATVRTAAGIHAYGNSHGFAGAWPSSTHRLSCSVIASNEGGMQQDYDYAVARDPQALRTAEEVGRRAGERAVRRLGARKIPTTDVPAVFEARVATSLFGHLVSAISGGSLYRRSSFLLDHLGKTIFPPWLSIREEPFLARGLGSRPFDDDGVTPQTRDIVSDGVLCSYVLGGYSARKLGMATTGNAGGITNWIVTHHDEDLRALMKRMHRGLLVTELMGFGVNGVTGDYSRGASGFWVENGEVEFPVEEVTIAGNLKDMFRCILAVGADVEMTSAIQTGSVLIEGMAVGGK
ncbi:MAG: metalloprotease PmbA [Chromatiales bacterium]